MPINNIQEACQFLKKENPLSYINYTNNLDIKFCVIGEDLFNLIRACPEYYLRNLHILYMIKDPQKNVDVPIDIQKKYPKIAVVLNPNLLFNYKDNDVCKEALFWEPEILRLFTENDFDKYWKAIVELFTTSNMGIKLIRYIPNNIQKKYQRSIIGFVLRNLNLIPYINEDIINEHFTTLVFKFPELLKTIPDHIIENNILNCVELLIKRPYEIVNFPNSILLKYPQIVIKAFQKTGAFVIFENIPREILEQYPEEIYFTLLKKHKDAAIGFIPEYLLNNDKIAIGIFKYAPYYVSKLPYDTIIKHIDDHIEVLYHNIKLLYDLPVEILLKHSDEILNIINDKYYDIDLYKLPLKFIQRNIDKILNISFENPILLKRIPIIILLENIDTIKAYINENGLTINLIKYLPNIILNKCIDVIENYIVENPFILSILPKFIINQLNRNILINIIKKHPDLGIYVSHIIFDNDYKTSEEERYYVPVNIGDMGTTLRFLHYFKKYQECDNKNSNECKQLKNILTQLINSNKLLDKLGINSINDILKFSYEEIKSIIYDYLNRHDKDKIFKKSIITNYYVAQRFKSTNKQNEKVFILYWSIELYNHFVNDPIILKFIRNDNILDSHFKNDGFLNTPIGWALVYQEKDAWYINQIQSDIITKLIQKYKQLVDTQKNKEPINLQELYIFLMTYNRSDYIRLNLLPDELLKTIKEKEKLLHLPELDDLEISDKEKYEIGKKAIEELQDYFFDIEADFSLFELEYIKKKLNWLLDNWYEIIFHFVMQEAIKAGVKHVYMNTSTTLDSDLSATAKQILYEKKPKELGMEKKKSNVRGIEEEFWYRENKNKLKLLKLASCFDNINMYKQADNIENMINCY